MGLNLKNCESMERKIGEIFQYNGEWYQCVEDTEGLREAIKLIKK